MKSFGLVLSCWTLLAGVAQAQPPSAAAVPDVPALTDAQRSAIQLLQSDSDRKAAQIAVQLAAVVQKIYDNNLSDTPTEELRVTLDDQMKELVWQMLLVKGNAMWAAFRVLTPEQKRIVRAEIAKPRPTGDLPDVMELIVKMFKLTGR
jgi:hypothetical protein